MLAHPEELAKNAWGNEKDIMIGSNSFENGVLVPLIISVPFLTQTLFDFPTWVPYPLNKTDDERKYFGDLLQLTYYGEITPKPTNFESVVIVSFYQDCLRKIANLNFSFLQNLLFGM